jgi:hypothetical protein
MGAKIFGIGLSKTGTTSLTNALKMLGYRAVHYPPTHQLTKILESHDAVTDTTVACCFPTLDRQYPNSRFILTTRDQSSWISSAAKEFQGRDVSEKWKRDVRQKLYGSITWDPDLFLSGYRRHHDYVKSYFKSRPQDLLVLDIVGGDGWEPLCNFLGKKQPIAGFPHRNKARIPA